MKFKVGDIIRGKKYNGYSVTNINMTLAEVIKVSNDYTVMEIRVLCHKNPYHIEDEYVVKNDDSKFELVKDYKEIVIRQFDGKEIIAVDNRHPDYKVVVQNEDFNCGAITAFEKIINRDNESKVYNGKVVCIEAEPPFLLYTPGKIYEVVNGKITNDENHTFPCEDDDRFKDFKELNERCAGEFLEVVE